MAWMAVLVVLSCITSLPEVAGLQTATGRVDLVGGGRAEAGLWGFELTLPQRPVTEDSEQVELSEEVDRFNFVLFSNGPEGPTCNCENAQHIEHSGPCN